MLIVNLPKTNSFVYGIRLKHDLSNEIRYVGLTSRGTKRLKEHLRTYQSISYSNYNLPLYKWMRKHYGHVVFEILEECPTDDLNLVESKWIHILKERGNRLLNLTEGGNGTIGYSLPDSAKEKIGSLHRGRVLTEEHKKKIGAGGRGKGGRNTTGEKHPQSKLTDEYVRQIRRLSGEGLTYKELGNKFGVNRLTISRVVRGVAWGHVE